MVAKDVASVVTGVICAGGVKGDVVCSTGGAFGVVMVVDIIMEVDIIEEVDIVVEVDIIVEVDVIMAIKQVKEMTMGREESNYLQDCIQDLQRYHKRKESCKIRRSGCAGRTDQETRTFPPGQQPAETLSQ